MSHGTLGSIPGGAGSFMQALAARAESPRVRPISACSGPAEWLVLARGGYR